VPSGYFCCTGKLISDVGGKQQHNKSYLPDALLLKSRLTMAGNTSKAEARLNNTNTADCREKTRNAGIGIIAAANKAHMLLSDVSNTLNPVFFNKTPVCS
jgi:hypothetical protein